MDIIFYSKYSPHSIDLLNILNINDITCFTKICIDEPRVRNQILKSTALSIRQVPCIITKDVGDSKYQTYEGELAFRLVNSIIESNSRRIIKESITEQNTNVGIQPKSNNNAGGFLHTSIEDLPEEVSIRQNTTDISSLEPESETGFQGRYSDMHINTDTPKLKPKDNKKISNRASEIEKERKTYIETNRSPSDRTGVTSINDNGIDITKGKPTEPIESVKTGAPINVNKLMSAIEERK